MSTARRVELTIPEETWQRIERARGDVPRAAWIKRAIQNQLAAAHRASLIRGVALQRSRLPPAEE